MNSSIRRVSRWLRAHWRESVVSLLVLVVLLVGSEFLLKALDVHSYILPTPTEVWAQFRVDLISHLFWIDVWTTSEEIIFGGLIGAAAGFALAVLVTLSPFVKSVLTPYLVVTQAIPKIAVAPLFVILLGFGLTSKFVICATISFFPLFVNAEAGMNSTDPDLLDLMRALRATRLQTLWTARLPAALPTIFAGLEMAFVFSVVGAIVGEFAGASKGLGYLINQRAFNLDQAGVFSALIVLSVLAMLLDALVRTVGWWFSRWQRVGGDVVTEIAGNLVVEPAARLSEDSDVGGEAAVSFGEVPPLPPLPYTDAKSRSLEEDLTS
ncbi:MAG TPA: ABC transporter permease [Acidimicrobiales bacterium]|nr:ABC transporter permease [Acidimicrobiales bacterium]